MPALFGNAEPHWAHNATQWPEACMTARDYGLLVEALQEALRNSSPEEYQGILTATVHIAQTLKNDNPSYFRMAKFIDLVCNEGLSTSHEDESSPN
jgi:hypothetical protein